MVGAMVVWLMGIGSFAEEIAKTGTYVGTLQSVDLTDPSITVGQKQTSKRFQVDKNASIFTLEKEEQSSLKDLQTGYTVKVTFSQTNGVATASSIVELKRPGEK